MCSAIVYSYCSCTPPPTKHGVVLVVTMLILWPMRILHQALWYGLIYEALVVESGGAVLVSGNLVIGFDCCLSAVDCYHPRWLLKQVCCNARIFYCVLRHIHCGSSLNTAYRGSHWPLCRKCSRASSWGSAGPRWIPLEYLGIREHAYYNMLQSVSGYALPTVQLQRCCVATPVQRSSSVLVVYPVWVYQILFELEIAHLCVMVCSCIATVLGIRHWNSLSGFPNYLFHWFNCGLNFAIALSIVQRWHLVLESPLIGKVMEELAWRWTGGHRPTTLYLEPLCDRMTQSVNCVEVLVLIGIISGQPVRQSTVTRNLCPP